MAHIERFGTNRGTNRNRPANNGPFDIEITGESTVDQYNRNKSVTDVQEFNAKIQAWSNSVKGGLVNSIASLVKEDKNLSRSLKTNYWAGGKSWGGTLAEIDSVGFSFRKEGIYIHMGVGRGYHRSGDSVNRLSKTNTMGRKPIPWFNPVIEQHIEELGKIVEEYVDNLVINYSRIYIA